MKMQRIKTIIRFIEKNSIVADIGTNHGVVPIYLLEENISKKVIATDISQNSLDKLENKLSEKPSELNIITRCSDGLKDIKPFEVDTIVISGMGGFLIEEILSSSLEVAKSSSKLILQPNNSIDHLRGWLNRNGFIIQEENDLFEKEIYYSVLCVLSGLEEPYNQTELKYGRSLIDNKSEVLREYLIRQIKEKEGILKQLERNDSIAVRERISELKKDIKEMNEVLKIYETE